MSSRHLVHILLSIIILLGVAGCNMPAIENLPELEKYLPDLAQPPESSQPFATTLPSPRETLVTFQVANPPGSTSADQIYLTILDEVTGLALNSRSVLMQTSDNLNSQSESKIFSVTLPFSIGTLVKYHYERQLDGVRVVEHLSDGSAVRYRMFHVTGQSEVRDVISRWTDTEFTLPVGRIDGEVVDAQTNMPIPNLLIAAGGAQTLSSSDGSFMLEGLPPGVHHLVAFAMDGSYETFQQGAMVAEGSTTPAVIKVDPAEFSNIVFVVKVPEGTPPVIPLRFAGNLLQLGNTFADLTGGMSTLAENMPVLSMLPDGRYTITLALPIGADVKYKYTLGDGFWNSERTRDGTFKLRQIIVPDQTVLVEETIETWNDISSNSITFDLTVPPETPSEDLITIQFKLPFGWTEPIPLWKLSESRWAYVLYSPLNLPGDFNYRYCRNFQCGTADDSQTPGPDAEGRKISKQDQPQTISDQITGWVDWFGRGDVQIPIVENVNGAGDGYRTGIEFATGYNPSWEYLFPQSLSHIQASGANLIVLTPTWSYGRGSKGNELPILSLLPGRDPYWNQLASWIEQAHSQGFNVALRPEANFSIPVSEWWLTAKRDESWWLVWFEQYSNFVMHHADLAERTNAQILLLGGEWLQPALPGKNLPDDSASNAPSDSEIRWRNLFHEVRSHFHGQIGWVISTEDLVLPPPFLDQVDRTYVELTVEPGKSISESIYQDLNNWLDISLMSFQYLNGRPLLLSVSCPSNPDMQTQVDCYQTLLSAVNKRSWISGFVSAGYYLPLQTQDMSPSVHGKPSEELLGRWYSEMVK